jgi:hypothetical protein
VRFSCFSENQAAESRMAISVSAYGGSFINETTFAICGGADSVKSHGTLLHEIGVPAALYSLNFTYNTLSPTSGTGSAFGHCHLWGADRSDPWEIHFSTFSHCSGVAIVEADNAVSGDRSLISYGNFFDNVVPPSGAIIAVEVMGLALEFCIFGGPRLEGIRLASGLGRPLIFEYCCNDSGASRCWTHSCWTYFGIHRFCWFDSGCNTRGRFVCENSEICDGSHQSSDEISPAGFIRGCLNWVLEFPGSKTRQKRLRVCKSS